MSILFGIDTTISIPLIAVIGYLAGKIIEVLIVRRRDSRQEFRSAYSRFAEAFTEYLQALENTEITLNALILGDFAKHDLAMRNFLRFLDGSRKKRFLRTWAQYQERYDQIKHLGPMAVAIAIVPPDVDITKAGHRPEEMTRWEIDRRKELHAIILNLLHIAYKKYFF